MSILSHDNFLRDMSLKEENKSRISPLASPVAQVGKFLTEGYYGATYLPEQAGW
jgi:hypothetical protein